MANIKITDLTAYGDPTSTDVLPIVDVGADVTKKVSVADLMENAGSGTAAAPGIAFDGDPNTGIYRPGADQVAISTNGTGRLFVDANGEVGIGTASPSDALHVYGRDPAIRVQQDAGQAGAAGFRTSAAGADSSANASYYQMNGGSMWGQTGGLGIRFGPPDRSNVSMLINTNNGNVGIGTTSPGSALEIDAAAATSPFIAKINTSEAARIDSSGRLLVGTSSAIAVGSTQHLFQAESVSAIPHGGSFVRHGGTVAGAGAAITLGRSRGTSAGAVTAVSDGDALGYLIFSGSNGSNFSNNAAWIKSEVDGEPFTSGDTTDLPGRLVFSTTADGASSPTERMRIGKGGEVSTFSNTQYPFAMRSANGAGTTNFSLVTTYSATDNLTGTIAFQIYTNGNVQNTNNSYGQISDVKLKENIVDANSQWDDLKGVKVRNFNFKEGQTHRQIGVIAQELEEVSPGLVYETPDRDAEGNDLGTVTKGVNYSVLYMKAVKALQEAMERIETLEAKVAALEAS